MQEMTKVSSDRMTSLPKGHYAASTIIAFSREAQKKVAEWQEAVCAELRPALRDALLLHAPTSAHITLDSIVDPTRAELDHDAIFTEGWPIYNTVVSNITRDTAPEKVHFKYARTNSDCVIILAEDPTEIVQKIRDRYRNDVDAQVSHRVSDARRKVGKDIIHYTPIRFRSQVPLQAIQEAVASAHRPNFTQPVDTIHIVRSMNMALEPYIIRATYKLLGSNS
ncbi:MAG: hypothetical protein HY817_03100 [Candidatus Abawacabacteria bacterium]|nr:hypothetical protein [Candidatus Abawacabacteria bacterium]